VCTILTVEGTVVATRFIAGGKELHGLRKRQLGRIARNRSKTGIIAEGEQDNAQLWAKIRNLDEDCAHQVSHRIVLFAREWQASILVFEHLGHFKPQKGKYSKRGNEKRSYWLRGKIFKYTKYKAWNEGGIITCRVSPRNTSRECARCGALVARYDATKPAEGYTPGAPLVFCAHCTMRGNSDRNASIVIGKRLLARYQTSSSQTPSKEKPHALLRRAERSSKEGGVRRSQDAKGKRRPSTNLAGHGTANAQGTAQDASARMVADASGMVCQLRLFNES
jgi:IS605 OrfB family transposase